MNYYVNQNNNFIRSKFTKFMDVLNKSEIIRDPYNEPAFVENIAGVCSCIVLLELILFSPSFVQSKIVEVKFDYSNWWNIILIHVFFDPEDVGDDRVTIKMFSPNKPPEEFRAFESYLPMEIEDAIFYYPTIKMITSISSFIQREDFARIPLVSSREEMTQMYRLHPSVLFEMKNRILQIIEVVENNFPHINMSEIERIVPSFEKNEIILVDHHAGLSHQYWNGNKFATQQLFRNFNRGKQGKNYKVYGMSLGISKHSIRIVNELVKIHNRHIARYLDNNIMKLYHRYAAIKRFNGSFLAKKLVRKRALRIISDVLYYQTYTSVDLYNAHKNKLYGSGFPKLFETEPFEENFVHLMVLIRSLNDEDNWYFIDNDEITIVKDVKSFVRDGYGFNYIDSMYWHEEESYGLNRKLKEYIKPFLLKDYMGKGLVGSTTTSTTTSE
ncbi:hypothetical protein SNEBB_000347 [Seison nebaliae]|nr:hypothetical protein SNEBB_000347 [Seison nebaliae]